MYDKKQWIRETQESDGTVRWHEGTLSWLIRCMDALHGFANVIVSNGGKCVDVPGAQFAVIPKCPPCYSEMTKKRRTTKRRRRITRRPILITSEGVSDE